jgi:hypothetical protein
MPVDCEVINEGTVFNAKTLNNFFNDIYEGVDEALLIGANAQGDGHGTRVVKNTDGGTSPGEFVPEWDLDALAKRIDEEQSEVAAITETLVPKTRVVAGKSLENDVELDSLTIRVDGVNVGTYNGSEEKTINIDIPQFPTMERRNIHFGTAWPLQVFSDSSASSWIWPPNVQGNANEVLLENNWHPLRMISTHSFGRQERRNLFELFGGNNSATIRAGVSKIIIMSDFEVDIGPNDFPNMTWASGNRIDLEFGGGYLISATVFKYTSPNQTFPASEAFLYYQNGNIRLNTISIRSSNSSGATIVIKTESCNMHEGVF